MNFKNTKSLGYRIADTLYLKGAMPTSALAEAMDADETQVCRQVSRMCFEGDLESNGGNVTLRTHLRRHFAEKHKDTSGFAEYKTELASAFKPWSGKYSLANALLREPIRTDFHVLNASSEFRPLGGA